MPGRTSTRYARSVAAAVVAVAALIIAANAGPARAADHDATRHTIQQQAEHGQGLDT